MISPLFRLFYHTLLLSLMVGWAFVWLKTPGLASYSLQLFCGSIIAYFVIKKLSGAEFWQLLPSPTSLEMAAATLAFLLLVGATGNLSSPLFAFSFVHLFFLAISTRTSTALIVTLEICLFHYGLSQHLNTIEFSSLLSLTIVMGFFLLIKAQFLKLFSLQLVMTAETASLEAKTTATQANLPEPEIDLAEIDELMTRALSSASSSPYQSPPPHAPAQTATT